MGTQAQVADRFAAGDYDLNLTADVLVIGGSIAGVWAAVAAVEAGAQVIVVEKGYVGTSGPMSQANTGIYYIKPDDPLQRDAMVNARMPLAFGLADSRWGERILDQSYRNLDTMAKWGFAFPRTSDGKEYRGGLRGPNVMIFLRHQLERLGVRILDHSPALELLVADGVAAGASGVNRQTGDTWRVKAGSVVIATGGTAFLSGSAGCGGLTGDGYLLAAEAGAEFSGMEFSGQYAGVRAGSGLSRGAYTGGAGTHLDKHGNKINPGRQLVKALLQDGEAWAILDKAPTKEHQELIRKAHAHCFLYFDHQGIDPFNEKYKVDFICEGTVRATGGLAIDANLQTTVPGLFAAGDVTSREKINGAGPPGGGPAAGWAFGAGTFAGQSAAKFAKALGNSLSGRKVEAIGGAGLRPTKAKRDDIQYQDILAQVQAEMLPLDRNYWRRGDQLEGSLTNFAALWGEIREGYGAVQTANRKDGARATLRAREAASLLASARWINASALERKETRGLHRRSDFPDLDPNQTHHLISGGVDEVWVKRKAVDGKVESLAS